MAVDQQVLFEAAREQGYSCFRIPAIVRSKQGTLLAFAEGRVDDCGDTGDIDMVLKRSTDGGRTWPPLWLVNKGGGDAGPCATPCTRTPHAGRLVFTQKPQEITVTELAAYLTSACVVPGAYRRALSPTELNDIRLSNADIPTGQVLRLPLDRTHGG